MPPDREIAAAVIFVLTLAAVITRPRRLDEAVAAAVGLSLFVYLAGLLVDHSPRPVLLLRGRPRWPAPAG